MLAFNRTSMELKVTGSKEDFKKITTFNRTRMELKGLKG